MAYVIEVTGSNPLKGWDALLKSGAGDWTTTTEDFTRYATIAELPEEIKGEDGGDLGRKYEGSTSSTVAFIVSE